MSRAPDALAVAGLQGFTSIDYPGRLAAVVFLQGCPWRCGYCHNPHLQPKGRGAGPSWSALRPWLHSRAGLLDAVVFSGGEPTLDPALPAALAEVRSLGFLTGLHSAGMAPRQLATLLPLLDWVGLDVKASLQQPATHAALTGRRGAHRAVRASLELLRASRIDWECRSTVDPRWHSDQALLDLVQELQELGVPRHALQAVRGVTAAGAAERLAHWAGAEFQARLRALRPDLLWR